MRKNKEGKVILFLEKLASLNRLLLINFLLEHKHLELTNTNITRKEAGLIIQYIKGEIRKPICYSLHVH